MNDERKFIQGFAEYKRLTEEERQIFLYQQLSKIDDLKEEIKRMTKKFADKNVEKIVYGMIGLIALWFLQQVFEFLSSK